MRICTLLLAVMMIWYRRACRSCTISRIHYYGYQCIHSSVVTHAACFRVARLWPKSCSPEPAVEKTQKPPGQTVGVVSPVLHLLWNRRVLLHGLPVIYRISCLYWQQKFAFYHLAPRWTSRFRQISSIALTPSLARTRKRLTAFRCGRQAGTISTMDF